ncbi:MAG: DNA methyltransferase [Gloeotrichia echinulata IR180]|jgi:DNA modification methylase
MTVELKNFFEKILKIEIERDVHTQTLLNIEKKSRSSFLPWKGQFSPQLIEYILEENILPGHRILDPFCGSGTTLYESVKKRVTCLGADINPAAYIFSSFVNFCQLRLVEREKIIKEVRYTASSNISSIKETVLFGGYEALKFNQEILCFYKNCTDSYYKLLIATGAIMLSMGSTDTADKKKFIKSLDSVLKSIQMLPLTKLNYLPLLSDARYLGEIKSKSIDLIITSPPYINVFNYHQNYRKSLEMLGWEPLKVAVSEIGANRKHRGNRFLTVIQYCMDMSEAFLEMRRVLNDNGKVVIIAGKESNVRGISFKNGTLLATIALESVGFEVRKWQERYFTNRYGEKICEDILTLTPSCCTNDQYLEISRSIAVSALYSALENAAGDVKKDIENAITDAFKVEISPKLNVKVPSIWRLNLDSVKNTIVE